MQKKENLKQAWWFPAVHMFMRISGWIIGPIVAALILGKFLDKIFYSKPWFFITLTAVAFIFSMFKLLMETLTQIRKIEKQTNKHKK